jgi:hypothetical protein
VNHLLEVRIAHVLTLEHAENLKDAIWNTVMNYSKENALNIDSDSIDLIVLDANDVL